MDKTTRVISIPQSNLSSSNYAHITKLLAIIDSNMEQGGQIHHALLANQNQALNLINLEKGSSQVIDQSNFTRAPIFTKEQLQEFGTGSIAKCFGPEYELLDHRVSPRIPNRDLLMIDHITLISGEPRKLGPPASICSEYKIPHDSWFLSENDYPGVPLSILMEIALQPCGFLSAYLGTSLVLPAENNRFRNLDGYIKFISSPDLSGKIISNRAALKDAFTSGGMHIQKYAFTLSSEGSIFLEGESTFGYFTSMAMDQQSGLGLLQHPVDTSVKKNADPIQPGNLHHKHLNLVDKVSFSSTSREPRNIVIFGEKILSKSEWFYTNHFFQDPVMPGSLGVEAIMQGLWAYIKEKGLLAQFKNPMFSFSKTSPFTWKYRGQVTPANEKINFQIYVKNEHLSTSELTLSADANFWVDALRIYSIKNLALSIREG